MTISIKLSYLILGICSLILISVSATLLFDSQPTSELAKLKTQDGSQVADRDRLEMQKPPSSENEAEVKKVIKTSMPQQKDRESTQIEINVESIGSADIPEGAVIYSKKLTQEQIEKSLASVMTDDPVYSKRMTEKQIAASENPMLEETLRGEELGQ